MKLMTQELEQAFRKQGSIMDKKEEDTVVIAHYFSSSWDWWATEYNAEKRIFFGLVKGFEIELGYFSLDELEENSCNVRPLGGIELDLYWRMKSLDEVRKSIREVPYVG